MRFGQLLYFLIYVFIFLSSCTKNSYHSYSYRDTNNNVIKGSRKNVVDKSIPSDGSMTIIGKNNIFETHISNALILGGGCDVHLVIIAENVHRILRINGGIIGNNVPHHHKNKIDTIRYASGSKKEINIKKEPYQEKSIHKNQKEEKLKHSVFTTDSILKNVNKELERLTQASNKEVNVFLDYFQETVSLEYALKYFTRKIKEGQKEYYYEIAQLYFYGIGLPMSVAKAMELYEQSAVIGHIDSIKQAGDIYWNGASDVKIDKKKAIYFYTLGSQLSDYHCQEMLKKTKKQ